MQRRSIPAQLAIHRDLDGRASRRPDRRSRRQLPPQTPLRLGYAVAASSCVPGLFEPFPLKDLYPSRVVRLVDGGVHDNQGIGALIEQDCNVLLVSDASGQM